MLAHIPAVLAKEEVSRLREALVGASWEDGAASGGASKNAKRNTQLSPESELSRKLGSTVAKAMLASPSFLAAAIPLRILPPLFERYEAGDRYDPHVDNAVRGDATTGARIRVDLAATLLLSEPEDYDGGELIVEDIFGSRTFKPRAGDVVLFSAGSPNMVTPITRGSRLASLVWLQSMIRSDEERDIICDLDAAIQELSPRIGGDDGDMRRLSAVYHNLIRIWGEA
ncbi:Fe2+-dependent dioxygenase [Methylocystis heyeri]|uniref:Fe2+-dependent dioxygenase n=1 Tax=Methylocystis heyeri TaxID=391905 RepID=A0A6B8KF32_9HYPH|nr:Fe2+-dependent dioxygenase [Methylocystis heyeri]QGM46229.1 Fe2+-dependent dioxygenase [Methylocystis heyeri]